MFGEGVVECWCRGGRHKLIVLFKGDGVVQLLLITSEHSVVYDLDVILVHAQLRLGSLLQLERHRLQAGPQRLFRFQSSILCLPLRMGQ